jgi:hypothetical protein
MALSLTIHASLVAICLRAPALNHQSEAARILATDKLATLVAGGHAPSRTKTETQYLFDAAACGPQPLPVALNVECDSVSGPVLAPLFWFGRGLHYGGGGRFEPPVGATDDPPATAEEVWGARVNAVPYNATALIAAASGTFDLAGTRDDLLALDALNPAADSEEWLDLYEELFG